MTAKEFKPNPIMTLGEMNQIRRTFRIFLSRPAGRKWIARSGNLQHSAPSPWLAVAGLLMEIGGMQ